MIVVFIPCVELGVISGVRCSGRGDGEGGGGLGPLAGAAGAAAGAAGAADGHVRHQLRVPRRQDAAQVDALGCTHGLIHLHSSWNLLPARSVRRPELLME